MAKKGKLLTALDAHKRRNYELERQKSLQKKAQKRKNAKLAANSLDEVEDNGEANSSAAQLEEDSEGWESEGSEDVRTCCGGRGVAGEGVI